MIDSTSLTFLVAVILIALAFDFVNGFNDSANAIATVVSTRVMSPVAAVAMAGVMNFVGAISGTAVAKTVGKGVVDPDTISLLTVAGGVAAAAIWVLLATRFGLPVSGSHSLIAGVAGAGIAQAGFGCPGLDWNPEDPSWSGVLTPVGPRRRLRHNAGHLLDLSETYARGDHSHI